MQFTFGKIAFLFSLKFAIHSLSNIVLKCSKCCHKNLWCQNILCKGESLEYFLLLNFENVWGLEPNQKVPSFRVMMVDFFQASGAKAIW